ncbi:unnamed protein product, partial [marine sediment metagenome]
SGIRFLAVTTAISFTSSVVSGADNHSVFISLPNQLTDCPTFTQTSRPEISVASTSPAGFSTTVVSSTATDSVDCCLVLN